MIVLRCVFLTVALVVFVQGGFAQKVNDRVRLESTNPLGIPVHPSAGDASYVRWDHGTEGVVTAVDSATGWFRVEAGAETGWVTKRYLVVLSEQEEDEDPTAEIEAHVVGTWNLEHFHMNAQRGFPENTSGGPTYGPRTPDDLARIADVIKNH